MTINEVRALASLPPIEGGDVTQSAASSSCRCCYSRNPYNTYCLMLYFITETYLKVNTPITANVDVTDVTPYIATQAALKEYSQS
jgi:hypothetical protein